MASMRLDKFLGCTGCCSRSDAKRWIRSGGVSVNGVPATSADRKIDPEQDAVTFCGRTVAYRRYTYILLNKPQGVVSATEDGRDKTVLDLLPDEVNRSGLFPCGRLDKNTLGLILLTDNGELAHRLLAPKSHVKKIYRFRAAHAITEEEAKRFENGLILEDGYETKPAQLELEASGDCGKITLTEGKYHQIKRMMEALDNKILELERIGFGDLRLDESLKRGEWRYLTEAEIEKLERHGTKKS